jgi:hypothetical protein
MFLAPYNVGNEVVHSVKVYNNTLINYFHYQSYENMRNGNENSDKGRAATKMILIKQAIIILQHNC